jgi:hypothetical protein
VLIVSTRQLIPPDLAEIPPGPELARILAEIEPSRLSSFDCVQVLKAQYRQASHERAKVMALMAEVGLCAGVRLAGDELRRRAEPDQFAADEVRAALVLTRRAAEAQFWVAHDLLTRLPAVHAAMLAGVLDEPRARVFSEWTLDLSPEQARAVCASLLPQAPTLTTGQLIEKIKRLAISVDPDWARRRYEQAVAERRVVGHRNADGSANLSGYNLPVERVAAASGHIDALAKATKRAGDSRPIDHIRAELFLGMTDGTFTGLDDATIVELLLTAAVDQPDPDRDDPDGAEHNGSNGTQDGDDEPHDDGLGGPDTGEPDGGGAGDGEQGCAAPEVLPASLDWAGVELRVQLSTLLGHDLYPAELAGWGPVHAELARELATTLGTAQWRFVVTDEHGYPVHCGITRARPSGTPARAAHCRAIVELQVPATVLRALAGDPAMVGEWAGVVVDLVRQLTEDHPGQVWDDPARRAPGTVLRRYLEIRDRFCVMIGCRTPAHHTDADHTCEHTDGGPTIGSNLGAACRHDHRLKGEGGWTLQQPKAGVFQWTSRLGHTYHRHPPKIIESLLDPVPRDQPPYPLTIPSEDGWQDDHIWEDPPPEPEPDPPPEPEPKPDDDLPPFLRASRAGGVGQARPVGRASR